MVFTELQFKDFGLYKSFFKNNSIYKDYYGSELNFKVIYLWRHFQKLENCINSDFIIVKGYYNSQVFFLPPLVKTEENFIKGINLIKNYCLKFKIPIVIKALNLSLQNLLLKNFSVKEIIKDRDNFEYIYLPEELSEYEGKKFHDKKNLLNQFNKYSFEIKKYNGYCYNELMEVLNRWNSLHTQWEVEDIALQHFLKHYKEFDLICELIYIDKKPEAFIGGAVCENNLGIIIFEKANTDFKGIYAALNSYFVKNNFSNCKYVSMQEDMGVLGLRKSKKSYNPAFLEEKYIAYI